MAGRDARWLGIWDIMRDVRILTGIFIIGVGLLIDAFNQVVNFYRSGYTDKYLREQVIEALVTFTVGFLLVAGLLLFFFNFKHFFQSD